jgi:stage II sporulation protein M
VKYPFNLYVFVSVLFAAGSVFGIFLVNALTLEQQQELAGEIGRYLIQMQLGGMEGDAASFWARFLTHVKWLLLIWVLGITVVGVPGVLALNFVKGCLIGFSCGMLLNEYSWKGILLSAASLAPHNLLAVPAMVIASAASVSFAVFVVKDRVLQQKGRLGPQFSSLTSTTIMMAFLLACAALVETFASPAVIGWTVPLILS